MATGTVYGGESRLTAARSTLRRTAVLALTLAVTGTSLLLYPTAALAVDQWAREVRFTTEDEVAAPRWQWGALNEGCDPDLSEVAQDRGDDLIDGLPYGASWQSESGGTICRTTTPFIWFGFSEGGVAPYDATPGSPLTEEVTVRFFVTGSVWAHPPHCTIALEARPSGSGTAIESWTVVHSDQVGSTFQSDQEYVLPEGTATLMIVMGIACNIGGVVLQEMTATEAGSCEGVATSAGDDGLVFPNPYITAHSWTGDEWGNLFRDDTVPNPGCEFTTDGHYTYVPPEGFDAGDTHQVGVEISSDPGACARVVIQWIAASGGKGILAESHCGANPGGATGPGHFIVNTNAPEGARGFAIVFVRGTILHGLYLANVEGDPILDNGADGTGSPGPHDGANPFEDCEPGSDFLAVGEWVAFAACLIMGLPVAIVQALVAALRDLFVPGPGLASRFDAFGDMFTSKVPFGWLSEVVGTINAGLSAGAAGVSLSFGYVGMTLDFTDTLDDALGALAPYRSWLAAGVWFMTALNVHYALMAATGAPVARAKG